MKKIVALLFCLASVLLPLSSTSYAETYRIGVGDKLRIHIDEWPSLKGDFTVGSNALLNLPVVGTIEVGGLAVEEISYRVSEALKRKKKLSERPDVVVEIAEYRPYYILGDVQRPSEYPFRPNLKVQEAISIAGGYYRPADVSAMRFERDAIKARGELETDQDKLVRLKIHEARLNAERAEKTTFDLPSDINGDRADDSLKQYIEAEKMALRDRVKEFKESVETHDKLIKLQEREIESLKLQITAEERQMAAITRELKQLQKLADKGLSRSSRAWTVERTLAQIVGTKQSLQTQIVRTQQNIATAQDRIATLKSDRLSKIDAGLLEVKSDKSEARSNIRTSQNLIAEAEQYGPIAVMQRMTRRGWELTAKISRKDDAGESKTIEVALTDAVQPGDVITIERLPQIDAVR